MGYVALPDRQPHTDNPLSPDNLVLTPTYRSPEFVTGRQGYVCLKHFEHFTPIHFHFNIDRCNKVVEEYIMRLSRNW